jgi:hypothetical protein
MEMNPISLFYFSERSVYMNKITRNELHSSLVSDLDKIGILNEQLAQSQNQNRLELNKIEQSAPQLGISPILPLNSIKVLAPLNESTRNYAGEDGVTEGQLDYEDCLFYKGVKFDAGQKVEFPITHTGDVKSGTVFLRFKTLQKFDSSLNGIYRLFEVFDVDGIPSVSANLHYQDSLAYNGIEIRLRRGGNVYQLVLNNMEFQNNTVYTLAVVWDFKDGEGNGNVAGYINGLIQKASTFPSTFIPKASAKLLVGNLVSGTEPAQCIIESVFFATEKIETSGILKLHRSPLYLEAIYNKEVYKPQYKVIGYKREVQDIVVLNYDETTETMWGMHKDNRAILLKSTDEGQNWHTFADFSTSNTVIISLVEICGDNLFVGVRDGNIATLRKSPKDTASFTTVLTFNNGRYPIGGWNFDEFNGNIIVSEYGAYGTDARLFLSTDGGNTFSVIRTLSSSTGDRHFHQSKFDPYTGYIWITTGDSVEETEYSTDLGKTWNVVTNNSNHQSTTISFTKDAVIFGSDSVAGGTVLRIYNKHTGEYKLLGNPTFKYLNHVYAMDIDDRGYLWWFGNREAMPGVVSTICISPDLGATPLLVEDLGTEIIHAPYRFVKTKYGYYLGNSKISQPLLK